jgi:hypothetical protein
MMVDAVYEAMLDRAHAAARDAAAKYLHGLGIKDAWPAGFTWVRIDGVERLARYGRARLKEGKAAGLPNAEQVALEHRYGSPSNPGWEWWGSQWTNAQSLDAKRAAAHAFQAELVSEGIQAKTGSRWD